MISARRLSPIRFGDARRPAGILVLVLVLGACASPQSVRLLDTRPIALPPRVLLHEVPFYPQEAHYCGPAALASVLTYHGIPTDQSELAQALYTPGLKGSLQVEMASATRSHGLLAYRLPPDLEVLLNEIAAGHPVVVLQNLGLTWYPAWHYAVALGYDLDAGDIVLHSGTHRAHRLPLKVFEQTWARAGHWALVALPPHEPPAHDDPLRYLKAASELEQTGQIGAAREAYTTATRRWPRNAIAHMGLGNTRYALGELPGAVAAFATATRVDPRSAAAYNNLAASLAELGCRDSAHQAIACALSLAEGQDPILQDTFRQIQRAPSSVPYASCPAIRCPGAHALQQAHQPPDQDPMQQR